MKAIILVGGEGTRLRPLTYSTVKSMVPVLNKPFIEYIIRHLCDHNIREIILAMGYKPDSIRDYFSNDASELGVKLVYSVEPAALGTAGAVKYAEKYVDDTVFVINGDVFTDIDFSDMLNFHRSKNAKVTIALTPVGDPTQFGVIETDSQQKVTRFLEKPGWEQVTSNLINAGTYILESDVLDRIPQNTYSMFEYDVFPGLLIDGEPVFGYVTDCYWMDMGTPEKYLQLNHDLLCGKSSQVAFNAGDVSIDERSPKNPQAEFRGSILVGDGCTMGKAVQFSGSVIIGSNCVVHDGAVIENSVLWQGVNVGERASLKNCIISSDSNIKSDAHIEGAIVVGNDIYADKIATINP